MVRAVMPAETRTASPVPAAVTAWNRITPVRASAIRGSLIAAGEKSTVVRIESGLGAGRDVIAKRAKRSGVLREAYVYEHLLPASGSGLRFFGVGSDDDASMAWLFVQDAAGVPFDASIHRHGRLVAEWLAALHASMEEVDANASSRLPRQDATTYATRLRAAGVALRRRQALGDGADGTSIFEACLETCGRLEAGWGRVVELSSLLPPTLVHGDISAENARIVGDAVYLFDWEKVGWGTPSVDVARVDLDTYAARAHEMWGVSSAMVEASAACGAIFRTLSHDWYAKSIRKLDLYRRRLAREMHAAGIAEELR